MIRQCRKCKRVLEVNKVNFDENVNSVTGYLTTICKHCKLGLIPKTKQYRNFAKREPNYNQIKLDYKQRSARFAVYNAVRNGTLPKVKTLNCVCCQTPARLYHHWSYELEHQTNVIPLCSKCHYKIHELLKHPIRSKQIDVSIML